MAFGNIIKQLAEIYENGSAENITKGKVFDDVYYREKYIYN